MEEIFMQTSINSNYNITSSCNLPPVYSTNQTYNNISLFSGYPGVSENTQAQSNLLEALIPLCLKEMTTKDALLIFKENYETATKTAHADNPFTQEHGIEFDDIELLARSKEASPELKKAAQYFLDNKSIYKEVCAQHKKTLFGRGITLEDIDKTMKSTDFE